MYPVGDHGGGLCGNHNHGQHLKKWVTVWPYVIMRVEPLMV